MTTTKARHFFDPSHVTVTCYVDADEWVRPGRFSVCIRVYVHVCEDGACICFRGQGVMEVVWIIEAIVSRYVVGMQVCPYMASARNVQSTLAWNKI